MIAFTSILTYSPTRRDRSYATLLGSARRGPARSAAASGRARGSVGRLAPMWAQACLGRAAWLRSFTVDPGVAADATFWAAELTCSAPS
jgi:hypothetical protein